jgi:hypothetical protein
MILSLAPCEREHPGMNINCAIEAASSRRGIDPALLRSQELQGWT